ncbi:hypothetical protein VSDG_03011 [Cytospora chrysosperma]|uniref:Uncharacterized protein n=1 Tax=Cytospora chrysosperma TaxID=252740 RepID=A0A423W8W3_CYTCH|nr:hypothetical protein VSDG_03011 [Valsa sordida]
MALTNTTKELQHRLFKLAMGGKLAWAPIDGARLGRALDIGAGYKIVDSITGNGKVLVPGLKTSLESTTQTL